MAEVFGPEGFPPHCRPAFAELWISTGEVGGIAALLRAILNDNRSTRLVELRAEATDQVHLLWRRLAALQTRLRLVDLCVLQRLDGALAAAATQLCEGLERIEWQQSSHYFDSFFPGDKPQPRALVHLRDACQKHWNDDRLLPEVEHLMLGRDPEAQAARLGEICERLIHVHRILRTFVERHPIHER
jgi:hypothetical protein